MISYDHFMQIKQNEKELGLDTTLPETYKEYTDSLYDAEYSKGSEQRRFMRQP